MGFFSPALSLLALARRASRQVFEKDAQRDDRLVEDGDRLVLGISGWHADEVESLGQRVFLESERFLEPSSDPVALDRVAMLAAHADTEAIPSELVGRRVDAQASAAVLCPVPEDSQELGSPPQTAGARKAEGVFGRSLLIVRVRSGHAGVHGFNGPSGTASGS